MVEDHACCVSRFLISYLDLRVASEGKALKSSYAWGILIQFSFLYRCIYMKYCESLPFPLLFLSVYSVLVFYHILPSLFLSLMNRVF